MSDSDPHQKTPAAPLPEDPGSQALNDALRSSFFLIQIIMIGLLVVFLGSGVFTVGPQERAVVLRFGRVVQPPGVTLGPGLHWSFPSPIDEHVRMPTTAFTNAQSTIGMYAIPAGMPEGMAPQPTPTLNPARDGYAITMDTNIIHVAARLTYSVKDPLQFEFQFADARALVTNDLNNALIYAASRFNVDAILSTNTAAFQETVLARVWDLIASQNLGIQAEQVEVTPLAPLMLKPLFELAVSARNQADTTRTRTQTETNTTLTAAWSQAGVITNRALIDKTNYVTQVKSDAKVFLDLLPQFQKDPASFMRIEQARIRNKVFGTASQIMYLNEGPGGKLWLMITPEQPQITVGK